MGGRRSIPVCISGCDGEYWVSGSCRLESIAGYYRSVIVSNCRCILLSATDRPCMEGAVITMLAYTPKATVQAAIGGIPLSLGFACGDTVLTVAVLAIVLTAPLGAFAIDLSYKRLLEAND